MKIEVIKHPGGMLTPASDMEMDSLNKLKSGGQYTIEIKRTRNPLFHKKMFVFLKFCFEHWQCDKEFMSEKKQFDYFRGRLTVLAGFFDEFIELDGSIRLEPKSLSFAQMDQETFEQCYSAMVNAAMKNIFHSADDNTFNQLMSFFS